MPGSFQMEVGVEGDSPGSESRGTRANWPVIARRRALPRPRVLWRSSSVA